MKKSKAIPIPPLRIGQTVRFDPAKIIGGFWTRSIPQPIFGVITYIHRSHGWFLVAYGNDLRMGFRFDDIGREVDLFG